MDYETKIYLEKFIEAIEELNSPDWWSIILTIINIGAFILVAMTQIKLQRQQTRAQEYELYKRLYKIVDEIYKEFNDLYANVYAGIVYLHTTKPNYWSAHKDIINELESKFREIEIDLTLKFRAYKKEVSYIKILFFLSRHLLDAVQKLYNDGNISCITDLDKMTSSFNQSHQILKDGILERITENNDKESLQKIFVAYDKMLKDAFNQNLLDEIQSKI